MFCSTASVLKPVIINSLAIIIITTTLLNGTTASSIPIRAIIADETKSLSANGSINFPKLVTRLYFLAMYPSKQSVIEARQNIPVAIYRATCLSKPNGQSKSTKKIGIIIILAIVNLLGKFIYSTLSPIKS